MAMKKSLINITLTDFIDFVNKSGGTKLTKVREIKKREDYHPSKDFYKILRDGIIEIHQGNGKKSDLDKILNELSNDVKIKNYPDIIRGYKKFWGRKDIQWFNPTTVHWKQGEVDINVNPELGLEYNGNFYIIKLYFKSDKLTKDRSGQILSLMESKLRKVVAVDEVLFAILDVRNSKLFINENKETIYLPLLDGELKSLEIIWKGIK
jgi:hypothetical protein